MAINDSTIFLTIAVNFCVFFKIKNARSDLRRATARTIVLYGWDACFAFSGCNILEINPYLVGCAGGEPAARSPDGNLFFRYYRQEISYLGRFMQQTAVAYSLPLMPKSNSSQQPIVSIEDEKHL
ncbi:MAG: hypothetical protein K2O82_07850 [Alistipes sp.]|nr:hypothetical protein [Alistipes sp.]